MRSRCLFSIVCLIVLALAFIGCGGSSGSCQGISLIVSPQNASADHAAVPPGNQVQFGASYKVPPGCAVATVVPQPVWTSSDPVNVIFSTQTNGLATCLNATPQSVTITANDHSMIATATLTCR